MGDSDPWGARIRGTSPISSVTNELRILSMELSILSLELSIYSKPRDRSLLNLATQATPSGFFLLEANA